MHSFPLESVDKDNYALFVSSSCRDTQYFDYGHGSSAQGYDDNYGKGKHSLWISPNRYDF